MRREFELSQKQLSDLLKASKPVPYMVVGGVAPRSQQENANDAWAGLGKEMGFDHMTVQSIPEKSTRFFTAEVRGDPMTVIEIPEKPKEAS